MPRPTYSPESVEQLHTLFRLYPEAADNLLDAIREHRIISSSTLYIEDDKPCGCIIGHTLFTIHGMSIINKWWSEAAVLRQRIVEETGQELSPGFLSMELDLMEDEDAEGNCPTLKSIIENWQEARLYEQSQERGHV